MPYFGDKGEERKVGKIEIKNLGNKKIRNRIMTKKPIIGFSLDYETVESYSKKPWFAIRENYCQSVSRFGAVPVCLPHEVGLADDYLDMIDGLVITGGAFDVPPSMYGDSSQHDTVELKENRTKFEWAVTEGAIERKIPILGICGGEQLLNVVLGGTLIQHIPDSFDSEIEHEQPNPRDEVGHSINIMQNTLLHKIISSDVAGVNSAHHQAVDKVAGDVIVNCTAPDSVIEGIELPTDIHPFCLGVQWHPEYFVTDADSKIMQAFVTACGAGK